MDAQLEPALDDLPSGVRLDEGRERPEADDAVLSEVLYLRPAAPAGDPAAASAFPAQLERCQLGERRT